MTAANRVPRRACLPVVLLAAACAGAPAADTDEHAGHAMPAATGSAATAQDPTLPAGAGDAVARLDASPRHAEWALVRSGEDSIRAFVVYPERSDRAPVVVVVHEIFGLSHWIRGVADQLAAEGFIAIAPDLLTMREVPAGPTSSPRKDSLPSRPTC